MAIDLDYQNTAFALVKPPSKFISTCRLKSVKERDELLQQASVKHLLIYYAKIERKSDGWYTVEPWSLDRASLPTIEQITPPVTEPVESIVEELVCGFYGCKFVAKSKSGLTLHQKKHEYVG